MDARSLFEREAQAQGLEVRGTLPDGRVVVARGDWELTINLENVARSAERDGDPGAIQRFVATILVSIQELPAWEAAKDQIRFSLEPADHEFGDTLREPVTETVVRVLVYVTPDEREIRWLTPSDLAEWQRERAEVEAVARANMDRLLSREAVSVQNIDGHRLGYFEGDSPFKAALLLSPSFKSAIERQVGWPIYAVLPCRDFVYFFSVKDHELLNRVGRVVVNEYRNSGYPITTEVLEISDQGVKAVGAFPAE